MYFEYGGALRTYLQTTYVGKKFYVLLNILSCLLMPIELIPFLRALNTS
jgi:hypothetical protein